MLKSTKLLTITASLMLLAAPAVAQNAVSGVNSETPRDAGINAQEAEALTDENGIEIDSNSITNSTVTESSEDGRIDAKEAGDDVSLEPVDGDVSYTRTDEDSRIDANEAGSQAN